MTKSPQTKIARRTLQIAVGIASLVPIMAGVTGVVLGPIMAKGMPPNNTTLDSHYRYMSGLLMGIGFGYWTTISNIETKTRQFQLLSAIVILGGFARLYSLIKIGVPDHAMLFGLGMELCVVPILTIWQNAVAHPRST